MKRLWIFVFSGCLVFWGGCASDPDKAFAREMMRIQPVEPPTFLTAELASLFGAANFTARVEVHKGMPSARPPMVGELSGRNGSLFFIADEQRGKRGMSGGLSALWDGPSQTAYLLNEPLQGYAPIRNSGTNAPLEVAQAGEEQMSGEACRKSVLSRRQGAELIPAIFVWRSIARQDLPIRVQTTNSAAAVTLQLSRIRMEAPPAELFTLPNGFKKYESTDAMMSELVHRRTDAASSRMRAREERYGTPKIDEEQEIQRPVRQY